MNKVFSERKSNYYHFSNRKTNDETVTFYKNPLPMQVILAMRNETPL